MESTTLKKPSARKTSDIAISDFDAAITVIFKKVNFRPAKELVVKIREHILRDALGKIQPQMIAPFLHEELTKIGCVTAPAIPAKAT